MQPFSLPPSTEEREAVRNEFVFLADAPNFDIKSPIKGIKSVSDIGDISSSSVEYRITYIMGQSNNVSRAVQQ